MTLPFCQELDPRLEVCDALDAVADWPFVVLLDSAGRSNERCRYSFLTADPWQRWIQPTSLTRHDPFAGPRTEWLRFRCDPISGLPPFQGGAIAMLAYELGCALEPWQPAGCDPFQLPSLAAGLFDWVIAWDHHRGQVWLISQGFPETEPAARTARARERAAAVIERLASIPSSPSASASRGQGHLTTAPHHSSAIPEGQWSQLDESTPQRWPVYCDFRREEYEAAVGETISAIRRGEIFQANLSQRLLVPLPTDRSTLYRTLRRVNPAPFAAYMACDDWALLSASPERFLQVSGRRVETRPIKGTRRRGAAEVDLFVRDELLASPKDRAENVMIVDLMRNDLSRVCRAGSVRVPQLCAIETYETVQHLVSVVQADLQPNVDLWDLLAATFPGGSITGAPKVQAMRTIAGLERTVRGPYTGTLAYLSFTGDMDSSILIRTFVERHGWLQLGIGGGITIGSQPADEYDETLHKAAGMLKAIEACVPVPR